MFPLPLALLRSGQYTGPPSPPPPPPPPGRALPAGARDPNSLPALPLASTPCTCRRHRPMTPRAEVRAPRASHFPPLSPSQRASPAEHPPPRKPRWCCVGFRAGPRPYPRKRAPLRALPPIQPPTPPPPRSLLHTQRQLLGLALSDIRCRDRGRAGQAPPGRRGRPRDMTALTFCCLFCPETGVV